MKDIQYKSTDAEILKKRFPIIKAETIDKLCHWLKENNAVIDSSECYDSQSGWHGINFKIGNADLSSNGYCLSNSAVELFLNGGKDPQWYRSWHPEYEEAKKWQESNTRKIIKA